MTKDWEGHFLFNTGSIRSAKGLEDIIEAMKYLLIFYSENNMYSQ